MNREDFGSTVEGSKVILFTLDNSGSIEVKITDLDCIITSLKVKDKILHDSMLFVSNDIIQVVRYTSIHFILRPC